jgi:hypothetical protein
MNASLATNSSSGGGDRGGGAGWVWCSGAGERACGSEREETRETPGFYIAREREGKAEGAAAGGLAIDGRRALRVMEG